MKTKDSNSTTIEKRRKALRRIISDYGQKGKKPSRKELLFELAKKGFKIDLSTLYRDKTSINGENSFLRDIAEANYSVYVEEMWDNLDFIIENSIENYHKNFPITKTTKHEKNGEIETTIQTIKNNPDSKQKFLRLILDATMEKASLIKGDTINFSVAFLSKKLHKFEDELSLYKTDVEQKTREIENFKEENLELRLKTSPPPEGYDKI